MKPATLFDKIWDAHVITQTRGGGDVLYIDRHFIHEVTSSQAFTGLAERGVKVRRPDKTVATADHNVPTKDQHLPIRDLLSRKQVETLTANCQKHGIQLYGLGHPFNGIVHVIGPELGLTQPGMTIVCGDSHTSTHGAFGTVAFGIGTSQVEQVLATQCTIQQKPKTMRINVWGALQPGVTAKDLALYIIASVGADGGTGHFVEFAGPTIEALNMEQRMTLCNMSIEMGARGGLIAPDQITFDYLREREYAPENMDAAMDLWSELKTEPQAKFDVEVHLDVSHLGPMVTYGTSPDMAMDVTAAIPITEGATHSQALEYMGFNSGEQLLGRPISHVFVGSCTNGRIQDLREVAQLVKGRRKADHVQAYIVPGSKQVEAQAVAEGLDKVLQEAGFEMRQPGCSACLAMNDDKVPSGEYCVATSNRNFEGRQGPGARTILASPFTAAASALNGYISDAREYLS